jgi:hypothetical protein
LLLLFNGNICIIKFCEVWQHFDDVLTIVWLLTDRVIPQPKHLQVLKILQVFNVLEVVDQVFAEVELGQFTAMLEVTQRFDLV